MSEFDDWRKERAFFTRYSTDVEYWVAETWVHQQAKIDALGSDKELLAVRAYTLGYRSGHHDTVEGQYVDVLSCDDDTYWAEDIAEWLAEQPTALEQQEQEDA